MYYYHHPLCHCNGVCAHRCSTRINYFLVLVSNTKVERRIDYEILVLYISNIPNLKLLFVYTYRKIIHPSNFFLKLSSVICNEHSPSSEAK
jgi:hypothetical protein